MNTELILTSQNEPTEVSENRHIAPHLRQESVRILAIRFDPKEGRIELQNSCGDLFLCKASPELLDLAVKLHNQPVVVQLQVRPDSTRLLSLRAEHDIPTPLTKEERWAHLLKNWSHTLKRLAE